MIALQSAAARPWSLADLLAGFAALPFESGLRVERMALDSRQSGPGCLFLACRGTRRHGLEYAEQAAENGCVAIAAEPDGRWGQTDLARLSAELALPVVPVAHLSRRAAEIAARFFGDPSRAMDVIGITGSNGKTSVGHFAARALAADVRCAVIGALGSGFPGELDASGPTAPDAVGLQQTLSSLHARGAGAVAMDVSSAALEQGRVGAVRFSHALFTNLTGDHFDDHGSFERDAEAKRRLFRFPELAWAVINHDDPHAASMVQALPQGTGLARYSLEPNADLGADAEIWVKARRIEVLPFGLRIAVESAVGSGEVVVRLIGRFNAANLLAVLALLLTRGLTLEAALERLCDMRGVPGRMECFGGGCAPLVVVDHANSPDALEKALSHLRLHCTGRLLTVFGCGGERERGKRALMGEVAERLSDRVILTDDNPRGEAGDVICADIANGMRRPSDALIERQRALAIRRAVALAGPGDAVLVAGKGHETIQDMGELKVHFSDRAQVVQALREWAGRGA
ncbi:MAG: UDP-N-acetylmuramoyl-L-alanyl-D-glutamate--2,6-diaminopimelate ligase [Thiohalocapsa sp.]|nr:UDP-N-acetylmuramoyl-L-alanyl-D-glutamate--2,6-diaminopimelate ligase [Thiohalocapsa sp.]MCF7988975.1 UDP-N-acetylmuramoyl-L-alanyl-D-glutamate--2,6-diaminopimelate ligase [Thiohalocapsa sp.]